MTPIFLFVNRNAFSVNELGSGEFGLVWLAEAVGISAFHPRDMLKERESGGRLSFLLRKRKRNRYLNCTTVTNVAIKNVKGLQELYNMRFLL